MEGGEQDLFRQSFGLYLCVKGDHEQGWRTSSFIGVSWPAIFSPSLWIKIRSKAEMKVQDMADLSLRVQPNLSFFLGAQHILLKPRMCPSSFKHV